MALISIISLLAKGLKVCVCILLCILYTENNWKENNNKRKLNLLVSPYFWWFFRIFESLRKVIKKGRGSGCWIRTSDQSVNSRLLYRWANPEYLNKTGIIAELKSFVKGFLKNFYKFLDKTSFWIKLFDHLEFLTPKNGSFLANLRTFHCLFSP